MLLFSGLFGLQNIDRLVWWRPRARADETVESVRDHLKSLHSSTEQQQLSLLMAFIILPINTMTQRLTVTAASQHINLACSINLYNRIPQMWQTCDPERWLYFASTSHVSATHSNDHVGICPETISEKREADGMKISLPTLAQIIQSVNQEFSQNQNTWMNKWTTELINLAASRYLNVNQATFKTRPSNQMPSRW